MIKEAVGKAINDLAVRYPDRESLLLPALDLAQRASGNTLSHDDIREIASRIGVTGSKAWGVATYYTMFNTKPVGTYHLQVDTNIPAMLAGAEEILAHLEKRLGIRAGGTTADGMFTLSVVEDLGSCGTCPVIQVNDTYYENMTVARINALIDSLKNGVMPERADESHWGSTCNILLKNRGKGSPVSLKEYRKSGGYAALAKARAMTPAEVLDVVKHAVVRGRGGAGFPAGMKWGFLPKNDPRPVYLICNADEGEPGTFKDRQIMQYDPHLLVEGMAIAAHTIGCKKAFIYIRGEFRFIATILETAIDEAKKDGMLGDLDIVVHMGAGSYECGEETALIESLEGKRGCPRIKPPFPANVGLYGCPTIVNNVETLSVMPYIVEHGADAFKAIGRTGNVGPKLFGVSGHVNKPGVYEYPLGTPLEDLLNAAGGVKGTLKAVIVGGLSVPILTAEEAAGLKMDYDSCAAAGTMLGSGGIIVVNETASIPHIALRAIQFYAHESCGQCTPCREGSAVIVRLLDGIVKGYGTKQDLDTVLSLCDTIMGTTLCPTGDAFSMPIRAMIRKFRSEFEALIH
ncbi:MAG: NADH-quinone oxidoreductase subunit NuoF [Chitinispirillaceae bacterium]|nr:NADH-quinone oxidoreductase subunit NuoF [Chitinispirillaceae bacterium]